MYIYIGDDVGMRVPSYIYYIRDTLSGQDIQDLRA